MKETYTKHFDGTSLNLGQVFSFYGTQVYFPLFLIVALTCTLTFPIKKPDELGVPSPLTRPTSNLLTIISCTWLMLPFVFFLFCKTFDISIFADRYFTPNLLALATIIALFASLFLKFLKPHKIVTGCYALACLCVLGVNSNSLAKAYAAESPRKALSFLDREDIPVITDSRRVAFHIGHYHSNETHLLVGSEKHASHMHKFSSKLNPLAIDPNGTTLRNAPTLKDELELIFISGPMGFDIKAFAQSNGYQVRKSVPLNSSEATNAHYLERKKPRTGSRPNI